MIKAKVVLQTPTFNRAVKRLKPNQKQALDVAIKTLMANPELGVKKRGDLAYLRVYKFKMNKQLALLGYIFNSSTLTLELLALGSHENFYRDVKRQP